MYRKKLKDYSLAKIRQALYLDNLWLDEKDRTERLFVKHSSGDLRKIHIPSMWIPAVKKLLEELIIIDPYIKFSQIKEKSGKLEFGTITLSQMSYSTLIWQLIEAAQKAIDIITLIQLESFDKYNTIKKACSC